MRFLNKNKWGHRNGGVTEMCMIWLWVDHGKPCRVDAKERWFNMSCLTVLNNVLEGIAVRTGMIGSSFALLVDRIGREQVTHQVGPGANLYTKCHLLGHSWAGLIQILIYGNSMWCRLFHSCIHIHTAVCGHGFHQLFSYPNIILGCRYAYCRRIHAHSPHSRGHP